MRDPVLSIRGLHVRLSRDGQASTVLDGIDLDMAPGEVVALVGESGSGKSTIGLAIQGLLPAESQPDISGSIRLAESEVVGAKPDALRQIRRTLVRGVPQDPMGALNPTMTIGRQMAETGLTSVEVLDWLTRVGLPDPERIARDMPHRLSGGQRQRVLIAMSMAAKPRLLIADEPTTALDVTVQAQILALLTDLAREQETAILFITHDLAVAAELSDRVMVLFGGRVAELGDTRKVVVSPAHPYSAGLLSARFDLDTDRNRQLTSLSIDRDRRRPEGTHCNYQARCPLASSACRLQRPDLKETAAGSRAACFHSDRVPELLLSARTAPEWPEAMASDADALELYRIRKSFPAGRNTLFGKKRHTQVLAGVDLRIRLGECVALVGESGSGKSTLLRIAAGLTQADEGDVSWFGGVPPQVVFQDAVAALTPWLSIGEQIRDRLRPLGLNRSEQDKRIAEALNLVGIDPALAEALPSELSGGQCQRVTVARAVVVPPRLLLCDEPISAMDVSLAAQTLNLLGTLRRQLGMGMLFVTHDLAAARLIADRIAVLEKGQLVEIGEPDQIISAPQAPYTKTLVSAVPRLHAQEARL
ncbi:ABC transporter ATP-binding protein [Devosia sp. Leaf64]|uniref:oligopeptide/dipeptide ABC transporter ATP-binding protein n=1 Tax=Devosia sp. Leaf64 TaxID=1736229 RepID=UPI0007129014|nr:ABC transporter ATP-binding protein [Devosia sp. Leaf64]KQN74844.1 peptide ABC transporter [Devosia sp. Leaf64]